MSIKKVYGQGERLQKARKKMDWTRDQLAAFFDLGSGTVSMLENGQRLLNPEKPKHQRIIRWIKKVEHTQKERAKELFKLPTINPRLSQNVTDSREKNSKNAARIAGLKTNKTAQIVTPPPGKISKKGHLSDLSEDKPSKSLNLSVSGDTGAPARQLRSLKNLERAPIIVRGITCAYCLKLKPDEEITVDDSLIAKYICEDCYRVDRAKNA